MNEHPTNPNLDGHPLIGHCPGCGRPLESARTGFGRQASRNGWVWHSWCAVTMLSPDEPLRLWRN